MSEEKLKLFSNKIGTFSLTLISCSAIIGSGWIFGSYQAVKFAGPSSIISWILGGLTILLIVLCSLEVCIMYPKAGGIIHFLNISHGKIAGFISAFACWLVISSIISFEAVIAVKYFSTWFPALNILYDFSTSQLTNSGVIAAVIFLLIFMLINYYTIGFFIKCTSFIALFKILIPTLTALAFIFYGFLSPGSNPVKESFAPYGISACFTAITSSGIIFSFNGFQSILSLAAEIKDPEESLPVALISSLIFTIILYILLQIAFIIALQPESLAVKNICEISLNTPFTQLALALNLNFVLIILYIDTVVSPSGTAIIHFAAVGRMIYGMNEYSQMPGKISKICPKYRTPRTAIAVNLFFCILLILVFRSWAKILSAISVGCILTFIVGPIALVTLRKDAPEEKRPFKLPFALIVAPLSFVLSTLILYWAGWKPIVTLASLVLAALSVYIAYGYRTNLTEFKKDLKASLWLIAYFIISCLMSVFGGTNFGGLGFIPNGYDHIIIILYSLIIFYWAANSGRNKK